MISETAKLVKGWNNILVISHASPDGDTLGSAAALIRGLKSLGINTGFACSDPIEKKFEYLFEGLSFSEFTPDKIITVDVADANLLGRYKELADKVDLAIDHHLGHREYAKASYVNIKSAANTENIYELLCEMGVSITKEIADAVFTGITTDTGCFRYKNVTARTHEIAAKMILAGADAGRINQVMFETKSRGQIKAEIAAMGSIEYYEDGKIALAAVTLDMMEKTGISEGDIDALVSVPRQIEGVLIGITLKQKPDGNFKASLRTNDPCDASAICGLLGGGGHKAAAGCSVRGDIETVKGKVLGVCRTYLESAGI